ncbi:MAG: tRNA-binding protein [Flavobacteriales bacterium]|jgi:tRNA-binding protein|nr:tRNA-binding protein [Flavobacteriales bacterium]
MNNIIWNDFERVLLCAGTVLTAEDLPAARVPAFVLTIDFGPYGHRRSSARITERYSKEALIGSQVIAVLNFPPKQIGHIMSECLVTGFPDAQGAIVLARPEQMVPNGSRLC